MLKRAFHHAYSAKDLNRMFRPDYDEVYFYEQDLVSPDDRRLTAFKAEREVKQAVEFDGSGSFVTSDPKIISLIIKHSLMAADSTETEFQDGFLAFLYPKLAYPGIEILSDEGGDRFVFSPAEFVYNELRRLEPRHRLLKEADKFARLV